MLQPEYPRAELTRLLQSLGSAPSARGRMQIADKIGNAFANLRLSDEERALAVSICEACASDIEVEVRKALSKQICRSPLLPRELAWKMANDVIAVAGPVLSYSTVLQDEDLLEIVASANQDKMLAIASRPTLSADVGEALVEAGDAGVVRTVISNPGASIEAAGLARALERFSDDCGVHTALVGRPQLPAGVAARLVPLIADTLVARLVSRADFDPELIFMIGRTAGDLALIAMPEQQAANLADALHDRGRLTPMLLLRALVLRQRSFVVRAIALLARETVDQVELQLLDGDSFKSRKVYLRAGLPAVLYSAFNAVLSLLHQVEKSTARPNQQDFERELLDRLTAAYPSIASHDIEAALADIEPLVRTIERKAAGLHTLH